MNQSNNRMTRGNSGKAKNPRALKAFADKTARTSSTAAPKVSEADKAKATEIGREMAKRDMAAKVAALPAQAQAVGLRRMAAPAPVAAAPAATTTTTAAAPATTTAAAAPAPVAPRPAFAPPGLANRPAGAAMPPGIANKQPMAPAVAPKTMKKGGMVRGNGCASRGLTKGRMI